MCFSETILIECVKSSDKLLTPFSEFHFIYLDNSLKIVNECDDNSTEKTATDINQAMNMIYIATLTIIAITILQWWLSM